MIRNTQTQSRKRSERYGRVAEWIAMLFLLVKGYRPLHHRKKLPHGEIDWIMVKGPHIIFVEVKFRPSHTMALQAVSPHQQRRLINAMSHFMAGTVHYASNMTGRFDIVTVNSFFLPRHYKDIIRG